MGNKETQHDICLIREGGNGSSLDHRFNNAVPQSTSEDPCVQDLDVSGYSNSVLDSILPLNLKKISVEELLELTGFRILDKSKVDSAKRPAE